MRFLIAAVSAVSLLIGASQDAFADKRVAFVVGNGAYKNVPALPNPAIDAKSMARLLRNVGFEVVEGANLSRDKMTDKLLDFGRKAAGADVALFYYAGHGIAVNGTNYLLPVDADLKSEMDVKLGAAINIDLTLEQTMGDAKVKLVFLDACRDNPFAAKIRSAKATRSANVGSGLAEMKSGEGTLLAFATGPGQTARSAGRQASALPSEGARPGTPADASPRRRLPAASTSMPSSRRPGGRRTTSIVKSLSQPFSTVYCSTASSRAAAGRRCCLSPPRACLRRWSAIARRWRSAIPGLLAPRPAWPGLRRGRGRGLTTTENARQEAARLRARCPRLLKLALHLLQTLLETEKGLFLRIDLLRHDVGRIGLLLQPLSDEGFRQRVAARRFGLPKAVKNAKNDVAFLRGHCVLVSLMGRAGCAA